jgi:hypothetical protein
VDKNQDDLDKTSNIEIDSLDNNEQFCQKKGYSGRF